MIDARRRRLVVGAAAAAATPGWARAMQSLGGFGGQGWPALSGQAPASPSAWPSDAAWSAIEAGSRSLDQDRSAETAAHDDAIGQVGATRQAPREPAPAPRPLVSDWRDLLLQRDRGIWLRRPATREEIRVVYWTPATGYLREGFRDVCNLMRDVRAGQSVPIDPALVDLLYGTQAWLAHYRINVPIDILSGYRTLATNAALEGAAKNSFHLQGRAADITIPSVSKQTLGMMVRQFGTGGVGFYMSRGFVHADTGPERTWGLAKR